MRHLFAGFILLLGLCNTSFAQQLDSTVWLPPITVTASRSPLSSRVAAAQISVLDSTAISHSASQSIADLLSRRSGIFVKRYGTTGLASVSLRGSSASQTLILIDGQRISDPQLGQLDLSILPTTLFSSAEVLHGSGSALYGSDALGGVINLRTDNQANAPLIQASGEVGAYGYKSGQIATRINLIKQLSWTSVFDYSTAKNDFPYINTALFPPAEARRDSAKHERVSVFSTLAFTGKSQIARLSAWWNTSERQLPGLSTTPPAGERQWDTHKRIWGSFTRQIPTGSIKISGFIQEGSLRYSNQQLELDNKGINTTLSSEITWHQKIGSLWEFVTGLSGSKTQAEHPSLSANPKQTQVAGHISATGNYDRLRVYPAIRYDRYNQSDSLNQAVTTAFSPQIGLNLRPFSFDGLHLKANIGRAFRMPTFNDRFWQPGGNQSLKPEKSLSMEAGILVHHHTIQWAFETELSWYKHNIDDQIVWQPAGIFWSPLNLSKVETTGIEFSGKVAYQMAENSLLDFGWTLNFTDAKDKSDPESADFDQQLRYVPKYTLKRWVFIKIGNFSAGVNTQYSAKRNITTDGRQVAAPYTLLDGQLSYQLNLDGAKLSFSVMMDNLLDEEVQIIKGYPLPPRNGRLKMHLSF